MCSVPRLHKEKRKSYKVHRKTGIEDSHQKQDITIRAKKLQILELSNSKVKYLVFKTFTKRYTKYK